MLAHAGYDDTDPLMAEQLRSPRSREKDRPRAPIGHPVPIEADGVILGMTIAHTLGVQFVATHAKVSSMDQSLWPSASYAESAALQLFKTGPRLSIDSGDGKNSRNWDLWRRIWTAAWHNPSPASHYMPANRAVER